MAGRAHARPARTGLTGQLPVQAVCACINFYNRQQIFPSPTLWPRGVVFCAVPREQAAVCRYSPTRNLIFGTPCPLLPH